MKRRMVEGAVAAAAAIAMLVGPSAACCGRQAFALEEQVRQRDQRNATGSAPSGNASVPNGSVNAPKRRASVSRTFTSRAKTPSSARNGRRRSNGSRLWSAAKAPRADAALYWRAYSFDKLNRQTEALTSVAELLKAYPSSRWLADARALEIQVRQRAGQPVSPEVQADEELKLFAIQGLQHQDPDQAIPMLEKLLQGTSSPRLKERALFVLAQSDAPRARQLLTTFARGGSNPDLQLKAIQYIGMTGFAPQPPAARGDLRLVHRHRREAADSSRAHDGGRPERVLAAATSEKSPELRAEAVRQLGMMGAETSCGSSIRRNPTSRSRSR